MYGYVCICWPVQTFNIAYIALHFSYFIVGKLFCSKCKTAVANVCLLGGGGGGREGGRRFIFFKQKAMFTLISLVS